VLCADWLGLSLEPVGGGSRSFLTVPPVRGVPTTCGDSGEMMGADVIGEPIAEGEVGVGARAGAAGADNFGAAGADLDWAIDGALILARSKGTKMQVQKLRICDIKLLLINHSRCTLDKVRTSGAPTSRRFGHVRGVKEAKCLADVEALRFPRLHGLGLAV
jgi:hypothetical protein